MNISEQQLNNMMSAVTTALQPLIRALPVTPVEWADQNYYLPKESSYGEGEWKTLPFQIAIMNSMGNDQIRTVNLIKSARVGYTKMLLGVVGYFIEHKSRNSLLFQPTDSAAEDFMKSHVEATIRDVPCLKKLSPWLGRKHRDNTLTLKRFSSGVGFWCLGGAAAKNYREKSVDVVCYDELSSFEPDVEKEGSPTLLGDKRIEGSVWPKSIRGSTPKIKGTCQIEKAANESAHFMRFYVPCPHCGEEQYLKFGDESTPFGLKWEKDSPESVFYLCEHHGCVIHQSELDQSNGRWICENTGMWTRDGLTFFSAADNEIPPPRSITFHIWTAYSPFTTWVQIVYDWLDALKDPNGLKTFVNTTLGETWEEAVGEKLDHQVLMDKVVHYTAAVPARVVYLTAGIDSQRNRFEMYVWGWAPGEEAFLVDKIIIMGRPDEEETLLRVDAAINKKYRHADGTEMTISRVCWDTGGIDGEIVYRPNWRWLGMRETAAKSFVDEVEAAWSEYAEGMFGEIDVEGKRTFTEFIREGVGVHAFNGEIFVQPVWDTETTQLFRTRFKAVSPKRVDTPGHGMGNRFLRAGVEVDRYGRAVAYHICEDDFPFSGSGRWERIPRELPTGRPAMLHIFEPVEDGQTRGANQFYSVMERLKMLDSLQATQLQSAIVKAMYAATIESELDTEKAFEYIAGAPQEQKDNPLINILEKFSSWYDTNNVTLGGVKIPHLFPGDDLKLQTAQDSDNGFSALEQALLRYIAAGLGVSYEQLSRDYSKVSYSSARASANESWRYFMGRRKFIASRLATQMFSCWLEEALLRGIIRPPRARFDFYQARSAWSRAEWIGAGRMAIDGLKEVQESVMRIEAGLSTYEKELALMGEDYQDIFRQQVRESAEREKAGLSRPVWIAQAYQQQIAESRRPEEETTPRET
ncbi:phage portal protein [Escherichia coli]|nr:phage portal protein [Escherichia coli]